MLLTEHDLGRGVQQQHELAPTSVSARALPAGTAATATACALRTAAPAAVDQHHQLIPQPRPMVEQKYRRRRPKQVDSRALKHNYRRRLQQPGQLKSPEGRKIDGNELTE
jgi:hypothetical protein